MKEDNNFAQRLRAGEVLTGTLVSLPSPDICELLANVGYDWLFIDAEHGAFNPQQTQAMLQAASPTPCVIRVPNHDRIWINKALDVGAAGIIVPQIKTAEEVEKLTPFTKYPPQGCRGLGIGRAHQYGMDYQQYLDTANKTTAVIIQIETRDAVDNIEAIIKAPHVDAVLIGPNDLSASLGKRGQFNDPIVVDAISMVTEVCNNNKMPLGIFGSSSDAVIPYIDKGYTLLTVGVDSLFMINSAKQTLKDIRG